MGIIINIFAIGISVVFTSMIYANYSTIIFYVGVIFAVYILLNAVLHVARLVNYYYWQKIGHKNVDWKANGEWAVITGSTDGIGKCYAQELAERKFNIVLISRNMDKLKNTAKELEDTYEIKTIVIVADMKQPNVYEAIDSQLKSLDIGVLVNNVGMFYNLPDFYHNIDGGSHEDLTNVNALSFLLLSAIVLPRMKEQNKGTIINISSAIGDLPFLIMGAYPACKRFINILSYALSHECSGTNVKIRLVSPYFVITSMYIAESTYWKPLAKDYVKSAINMTYSSVLKSYGYFSHELLHLACILLPKSYVLNRMDLFLFDIKMDILELLKQKK